MKNHLVDTYSGNLANPFLEKAEEGKNTKIKKKTTENVGGGVRERK